MSSPPNTLSNEDRERALKILEVVSPFLTQGQKLIVRSLLEKPMDTEKLGEHLEKHGSTQTKRAFCGTPTAMNAQISKTRKRLDKFYAGPKGSVQRLRLAIPDGEKNEKRFVVVTDNVPPIGALAFWAAHFGNGKPTRILIGRPTFLRSADTGLLIRNEVFDGDEGFLRGLLKKDYPKLAGGNVDEIKPYVSLADVQAMLAVYSFFDSRRKDYGQPRPEIIQDDDSNEGPNLVILGTPFDNPEIRKLEDDALHAFMEWNWAGLGSLYLKRDWTGLSTTMPNGDFRVWVHRRSSESRCETLINASNSELIGPICELLTSDEEMKAAIQELWRGKAWTGFPANFKIQFRVRLSSNGSRIRKIWVQQYREGQDSFPEPVFGEQGLLIGGHPE